MQKLKRKQSNFITSLLFIIGITFMTYGILRSEVPVMFEKAINICLECIGIG